MSSLHATEFTHSPHPLPTLQLHIFARTLNTDHAGVEVSDGASVATLKKAIIAEFKLDIGPNRVRLLREVGGGAPVPLDSCERLADQGVKEGSKVLVEVIAPDIPATSAAETAAVENYKRLFAALRAAELEPIPSSRSSLIKLPEGVQWPQLGAEPLFVRDFYCGLYEGPLASLDPGCTSKLRKFIIRGNAGIGKSAFGAYLLWRAVKAGRTVVYTSDKVDASFVFHSSGEVEVFSAEDFGRRTWGILQQASTVFICDGIQPPVKNAFTVLITSPKRERYREFFKLVDCEILTVPVFSRQEIRDILHTCFLQLVPHEDLVWELYRKWGGIVRYVLAKQGQSSQSLLKTSLTGIDLDDLIFHLGADEIESDDKASHRLLHLKPVGEDEHEFSDPFNIDSYMLARTELASQYAVELVYNALEQRHLQRLNNLLAQPISSASHAKLYGDMYEIGAARKLLNGGSFEAFDCSIGSAVEGGIVISPSTRHTFSSVENLRSLRLSHQGQPITYAPTSGTFTAVDAVLPNNALANFTVNVKHVAKMYGNGKKSKEGVAPVADALGIEGDIVFYWVLPRTRYDEACKAKVPFAVTGQSPGDTRKVKQFFVCVPFDFLRTL